MRNLAVAITAGSVLFISTPAPAPAGVGNSHRQPASASIPCPGTLDEDYTEGGNMHGAFFQMSLTCWSGPHVFWVISSGQGCNTDEADQNGDICTKAMSVPTELRTDRDSERTHVYALTKYVFAKDCQSTSILERRMATRSNKVFNSGTTTGFMCKEINFVDGTVDDNGEALPNTRFRSAPLTTTGGDMKMTDTPAELTIFGVEDKDKGVYFTRTKGEIKREADQ